MARAGYCIGCGEQVWLTPEGCCPKGHGPQDIEGIHEASDAPPPDAGAAAQPGMGPSGPIPEWAARSASPPQPGAYPPVAGPSQAPTPGAGAYPIPPTPPQYGSDLQIRIPQQADKQARIALILGVISLLAWCLPIVGLPVSITGLVYGAKGLKSETNKVMAIIGLVLCALGLAASLINGVLGAVSGFQSATTPPPAPPIPPPQ